MTTALNEHASDVASALAEVDNAVSLPTLIAANVDLLDQHVPEGSAAPSDADRAEWRASIKGMGAVEARISGRSHVAGWSQFAMCVLMYQHAPDNQFSDTFGEDKFKKPSSNHEFACAASALYGLDVGDPVDKTNNSKRVYSLCAQYDGLLRTMRKQCLRVEDLHLNRDSVCRLLIVIENAGGTNALERKEVVDDDRSPQPIVLDAKERDELLHERAMEDLRGERPVEPQLVFGVMQEDGTVKVLPVSAGILNQAVVAQAKPLPRTQAFAEMLEMGGCVREEETQELKRKDSDPNDNRSELRIDERQVVWHPDGKITQSRLLAQNGTVVVECRNHEPHIILGEAVQGHTRLETVLRKRIEVNICPADRRPVFEIGVAAAEDRKSAVGRLMVSTRAASDEKHKALGPLLQRLAGKHIPKDVDPATLTARAHCEVARDAFRSHSETYIEKAGKAVQNAAKRKNGKPQTQPDVSITIGGDGIALFCAKADSEPKKVAAGRVHGSASINVRLDDYVAFLSAFNKVFAEVNTDVRCEMGERVLTMAFSTGSAAYRVFIPQANNGVRSDRCITDIAHQEWPKGTVLKPGAEA